jgi:hypothetical protein
MSKTLHALRNEFKLAFLEECSSLSIHEKSEWIEEFFLDVLKNPTAAEMGPVVRKKSNREGHVVQCPYGSKIFMNTAECGRWILENAHVQFSTEYKDIQVSSTLSPKDIRLKVTPEFQAVYQRIGILCKSAKYMNWCYLDPREKTKDLGIVPTDEERQKHVRKLAGNKFFAKHRGHLAEFVITDDGKFKTPGGFVFTAPTPALQFQWRDKMNKKELSFNGWVAKSEDGVQLDVYIRNYIQKEVA